jgi:transposase
MRAYSQDLRDRVLQALGRGEGPSAIARRLEVSRFWVYQVRDRLVMDGERSSRRVGGYRRSVLADQEATLREWLAADPGLTLEALCARLASDLQIRLKVGGLWKQLHKWGLSLKKNPARQRARAAGRGRGASSLARTSGRTIPGPSGVSR